MTFRCVGCGITFSGVEPGSVNPNGHARCEACEKRHSTKATYSCKAKSHPTKYTFIATDADGKFYGLCKECDSRQEMEKV